MATGDLVTLATCLIVSHTVQTPDLEKGINDSVWKCAKCGQFGLPLGVRDR